MSSPAAGPPGKTGPELAYTGVLTKPSLEAWSSPDDYQSLSISETLGSMAEEGGYARSAEVTLTPNLLYHTAVGVPTEATYASLDAGLPKADIPLQANPLYAATEMGGTLQ